MDEPGDVFSQARRRYACTHDVVGFRDDAMPATSSRGQCCTATGTKHRGGAGAMMSAVGLVVELTSVSVTPSNYI